MSTPPRRDASVRGRAPRTTARRVAGRSTTSRRPADRPVEQDGQVDDTGLDDTRGAGPVDAAAPAPVWSTDEPLELPEPAARDAADEPDDEDERAPRRDFSTRLSVILLVVAVLLAGGGLALWLRANAIDDRAGTNTALVDVSETVDLTGTVKDGLERIFSFNYQNTDATAQAAKEVLTGDAATQYDALIGQVREQAPAQQLVLTSKAVAAGVSVLEGDRATLLVFLNQTSTRAGGQPTYGGAQLTVTAQRVDGVWRIASLQPR